MAENLPRYLPSGAVPPDIGAGVVSGWNVAVLVTAGFSLLGALVVLLARERTARAEPAPSV